MSRRVPASGKDGRLAASRLLAFGVAWLCFGAEALAATSRAGPDQTVLPGALVVLDGSQSVAEDGQPLSYAWRQLQGPPVSLANPGSAVTEFASIVPVAEWAVLIFELRVTEQSGASVTDTVAIVVSETLTAQNRLKLVSPPGEYMGQGNSLDVPFDAASFSISSNAENIVQIMLSNLPGNGSELRLTLARADEQPLAVGRYEFAYRNGTRAGKHSLRALRTISCGSSLGNFIIHDIGYDAAGGITRLAVDFQKFCLEAANVDLPFTGYLRFNSVVPVLSRQPIASAGEDLVVIPGQSVTLSSRNSWPGSVPTGSYRWQQLNGPVLPGLSTTAQQISFTAPDVPPSGTTFEFELTLTNDAGASSTDRVSVSVRGAAERKTYVYIEVEPTGIPDWAFGTQAWLFDTNIGRIMLGTGMSGGAATQVSIDIAELDSWHISFGAGGGRPLAVGDYPNVQRFPAADHPSLDVGGSGRGYNKTYGSAVIHDIEFAPDGTVSSLAMDFQFKGDAGPRVFGVVRINSTVEFIAAGSIASAGADQSAIGGDYLRLGPEQSYVGSTPIVGVSWRQVGGPAVQLTSMSGTIVFFTAPPEGGVFEFELEIRTSDGRISRSRITVTIAPSGTPRSAFVISGEQGETLTRGVLIFHPIEETVLRLLDPRAAGRFVEVLLGATTGTFPTAPDQAYLLLVPRRPDPTVLGTLVPGAYESAAYYRLRHDIVDKPVISFGVNGLTCISPRGRFVVHEVDWDQSNVTRLAVDLQQTCEPTGQYLWAQVRLNSAVPVRAPAPLATAGPDLIVRGGRDFVLDGFASGSWFDPFPSYQWRQTGGAAVGIAQPAFRATSAVAAPFALGQAVSTLELEVADAIGRRSVDSVNITVLGADQPSREVDTTRMRTVNGMVIKHMRHDVNNAYFETGETGLRQSTLNSYARDVFGLMIRANIDNRIPLGNLKVTAGSASDFNSSLAAQVELFEVDEFNDFLGCSLPDGVLRVAEAEFTNSGFTKLAVDFDLRCPDGWTYRGVSRFDSAVAIEPGRVFAYAGPDRLSGENASVMLDGTASLITQAPIREYRWRQLAGPAVALTSPTPGIATFTVPQLNGDTDFSFELEITGHQGERGTDTVTIRAEDFSQPPPPPPPPPPTGGGGGGGGSTPVWLLAVLWVLRAVSVRRPGAAAAT